MCHIKMGERDKKIIYYFSGTGNSLKAARITAADLMRYEEVISSEQENP